MVIESINVVSVLFKVMFGEIVKIDNVIGVGNIFM